MLKLDTNRTNAFANSLINMTSRDRNSFPPTVFPKTYNLQSFKTSIHKYLRLLPNPKISSYLHDTRLHRGLQRLYLFGATSSCIDIIIKKKKKNNCPQNQNSYENVHRLRKINNINNIILKKNKLKWPPI